jgi:hypothetical protein
MQHHFGETVHLNFSDPICKMIGKMLSSGRNMHFVDSIAKKRKYETSFPLFISERMRRQTGTHLSPTEIMELNSIIKEFFYRDLFIQLDAELRADESFVIKHGILNMCREMGATDDDVPLDTIQKRYQRHRKATGGLIKQTWARRIAQNAQKKSYKDIAA